MSRRSTGAFIQELKRALGYRGAKVASIKDVGYAPKAPPPPPLTVKRCCGGPRCNRHDGLLHCECEPVVPESEFPRTCALSGDPGYRCGHCVICLWEIEAERWNSVSPWTKILTLTRDKGRPAFSSVDAAIVALADWEKHDRWAPSAMGGMLDRLGDGGGPGGTRGATAPDTALHRSADSMIHVRAAMAHAFQDPVAHDFPLGRDDCMNVLMLMTGGVLPRKPAADVIAEQFTVRASDVRRIVRHGRSVMAADLSARGLIPLPDRSSKAMAMVRDRLEVLQRRADRGRM